MEGFKVSHPFNRKGVVLNVDFVENEDEGKTGFVQDSAEGRI